VTVLAALLGVSAGLVGIFDTVPYLRDVMRGSTRPHRGTWLIWSALAVVVCLSQWADGASWSLIMLLTQAVLTTACSRSRSLPELLILTCGSTTASRCSGRCLVRRRKLLCGADQAGVVAAQDQCPYSATGFVGR